MWARILSAALGIWLILAPAVLNYTDPAQINDRIVGPVVFGSAFIAIWQLMRPLRWIELVAGAWLLVAPLFFGYMTASAINSLVVGLLLVVLAFLGGKTGKRFGGGWASLLRSEAHDDR